jgi:two-component system, OmpR family, alkaline phosphatase synthesis response regulator PhoP
MTKRVLIAEDEESIVASIEFLMRKCGYETRVTRDGPSAMGCLNDFRPDLVVLDIMLPGRSGFEICRRIRSDARLQGTRVLMLTAKGDPAEVAKGLAAGADDYMSKPFATKELVARARALLGDAVPEIPRS